MAAKLVGLRALEVRLALLARRISSAGEDAIDDEAEATAREWRDAAPVHSGEYRGSIKVVDGEIISDADHAPFVEFGTSTMAAQPVAQAATERARVRIPRSVAKALRRALP